MKVESKDVGPAPLILFDGVCNLCTWAVGFVLARERTETFQFASLQSERARELREAGIIDDSLKSLVLIQNGSVFFESDAALRVALELRGLGILARAGLLIPRHLRDWLYRVIARNRYQWFGRRGTCLVPSPELRRRFLD
jgi:predicted DCC family thiol-disulfide oxidoreductase YuxK